MAIALDLFQPFEWHHKVYAGTQRYAREVGTWQCAIDEFPEVSLPGRRTRKMACDGIIARATKATAEAAQRLGIPLVNTWFNSPVPGLRGVYVDFDAAGRLCAEHLLGRGFRRFGYLIRRRDRSEPIKYRAFAGRLAEEGYSCQRATYPVASTGEAAKWAAMQKAVRAWLGALTPPVGVCLREPHAARQIEQMCRNRSWRVPQDVAILCGHNEDTICEHTDPGLSSVDYNWERIGYEAAAMLDRLMDGEPPQPEPLLLPPTGILQRASTDFFAVEDELVSEALRYIAANLHKSINVSDVVEAIEMSRSTLERKFRDHLGLPIAKEIARLRLERVKRHLTESGMHIKRIAYETGFVDATTLCRVFRRELGTTPGQYRKQVLGSKR